MVFAILYVRSFYAGPSPDQLPPGILRGNVSMAGMSDYPIDNGSTAIILGIHNTDGWKYASPIFIESEGGHYYYNMSIFPGHFMITLDNASYTSQDLPEKITIESNKETVVDITLMPVASNRTLA